MSPLILTKEELTKRFVNSGRGILSGCYAGKANELDVFSRDSSMGAVRNLKGQPLESIVVPKNAAWVDTAEYHQLWNEIEDAMSRLKAQNFGRGAMNVAQFPDDYYTMIDRIRIDITRRRIENMDFTSEIAQEITNTNFGRSIRLDEFLPYAGAFKEIKGTGDTIPLIQQKTGGTDTIVMHIFALGWERTLEDELYNLDIFSLQKVNIAVARAYTALRNSRNGIGTAIALSAAGGWPLNQRVAASIGYATYDLNLYNTLRNAERKLAALLDPQTLQEIDASRMCLLVRENNVLKDLSRVVGGKLENGAVAYASSISLEPLGIDEIWQYKGDSIFVGTEDLEYPGVPAGKAYLFIPARGTTAPNFVLNKRGLTQEVGRGDVMTLSREKRAWYCAQTEYQTEWFGEAAGGAAHTGFIVEVELPTFDEET
jgi:hypothetical protein